MRGGGGGGGGGGTSGEAPGEGGEAVGTLRAGPELRAVLVQHVTILSVSGGSAEKRLRLTKLVTERGVPLDFPAIRGEDDAMKLVANRLRRAAKRMGRR